MIKIDSTDISAKRKKIHDQVNSYFKKERRRKVTLKKKEDERYFKKERRRKFL